MARTCAAMALAVRRLSPVIISTWMPMLLSVCTASADSALTGSAMANMAQSVPAEESGCERAKVTACCSCSAKVTIDGHQDGRLSFGLVARHRCVHVGLHVVAVPAHPFPVPDQNRVGRRLS